jgi:quercetin dioxygenase-like cupin family protein
MPHDPGRTPMADESYSPKHGGRPIEAPIMSFDLMAELEQLRRQPSYDAGSPTGRTLLKVPDLRIVLMALRAGGRMREHHASGPISIQALAGSVRVRVSDATFDLSAGQLLALESGIRHDVEAVGDTAFLLSIGRTTYDHVSDMHEPGD